MYNQFNHGRSYCGLDIAWPGDELMVAENFNNMLLLLFLVILCIRLSNKVLILLISQDLPLPNLRQLLFFITWTNALGQQEKADEGD
jgi:hypothetical protein